MIKVSNIERFATHDGPGIRTTIFLKGCPLHCPWCANPETWTLDSVLMHDERKCVGCQNCRKECSQNAITFEPKFVLNKNLCNGCGNCVDVCIPDALSINGKDMEIDEIIDEIKKDDIYYKNSNGGITISGGEPLFQFDKVYELLKRLKELGYHTAIETTGMYPLEQLKKVEPYIDIFLHDIKHMDAIKLKNYTGASKDIIFANLEYLSETCPDKVIIRVPVIPMFNYDDKTLKDIILYAKSKNFKEVDLLPYHPLGKNKWHNLQKNYAYEDEKMMDKEVLSKYTLFGKNNDIFVKIGG